MDKNHTERIRKPTLFLSLKWSALLLLSIVLLSINSFFYFYHSNTVSQDFSAHRDLVFQRNTDQIESLIRQSSNYLEQIAEMIPTMYGMNSVFSASDPGQLSENFSKHWLNLQIQTDIDSAGFFSTEGEMLATWGDKTLQQTFLLEKVKNIAKATINQQVPVDPIFCSTLCIQYVFVPVISNGKVWGGIVLGRSLANIILNFSTTQKVDVGILTNRTSKSESQSLSKNILRQWNMQVMALSNYPTLFPIINNAQNENKFPGANSNIISRWNKQSYELASYSLSSNKNIQLLFIDDITSELNAISLDNQEIAMIGWSSVLISECVLLLILWGPLSKLIKTSRTVPLLASSEFEKARNEVSLVTHSSKVKDEIDILNEALINLSFQLEELEDNVQDRSHALARKVDELTHQRDFINHLVNSAQVIIITHNAMGQILLVNKLAGEISGYSNREILAHKFSEFTQSDLTDSTYESQLLKVSSGDYSRLKNETVLHCKDGNNRTIAWMHSHLDSKTQDDATVLSVGLDISERKAHEEEISWLADHDSLTGLYNRRCFNAILKNSLSIANRYEHKVALLFLDMDNFKNINDTMGHKTGDILIKAVADCLKLILRESDSIARLGGDEFAIILNHSSENDAAEVATKINKHLFSLRLPMVDSNHRIASSIGVAIYPDHAENEGELLSNADVAMYQAKSHGRGCWHMFSKSDLIKESMETQLYWRYKIIDALAVDKFELHFQPIMKLSDHSISHYEALLRMIDDDGKLILPTPFIEVAEKTGLIHEIDHIVVKKCIQYIQAFNQSNEFICLAINLSAHSFSDNELLNLLKEELASSTIDSSQIIFEITETAALSDLSGAARLISKIRDLGCRFALDDFGVGFSSFYYLKELPVDYVKIDGSFIQNLPQNRNDQILVKAMTEIAREFGKKTVAEFVEDEQTLKILQNYQVDYAQGFHIGKPLSKTFSKAA